MKILEFFRNGKTYMYPDGSIATSERILQDFPAVGVFPHVIETDENRQVCYAVENFSALKSMYNIESQLTNEEALSLLQEKINEEPEVGISDDTRIADALEDLVVLNMPDEEV